MKIALFVKEELQETDIATYIISKISEHNFDIDQDHPDYVLFVGGDGTFLRAVNEYIDQIDDIQFVGINEGTLGFYTDFVIDELDALLDDLELGEYNVKHSRLLETNIAGQDILAVNEIRVENPFHTLICKVSINGVYLETFRGNGLCVCSSNGSTAYNKSLGGSVVAMDANTMQLTEIASINNRVYRSLNSSIVLDANAHISFEGEFKEAVFGYDYLTTRGDTNKIDIKLSSKSVTFIYKKNRTFIDKVRESLIK